MALLWHCRQREQAARSWGHALRLIHRIRFERAGDLAFPEAQGQRLGKRISRPSWQRLLPYLSVLKDNVVDAATLTEVLKRTRTQLYG